MNSLYSALPLPVTTMSVMALPVLSVTLQANSTVKSVAGQVNGLEDDDVVVTLGVNTKCTVFAKAAAVGVSSFVTLVYTSVNDL